MLGPKSDNSITDGDGNTQIGHNSGTISVGLSFEQHEAALARALVVKQLDLERAHKAEKALIQQELDALRDQQRNAEQSYQLKLKELAETKELLSRYKSQIDQQKRIAAFAAIDTGETALAQILIKELVAKARSRQEGAAKEEAELEFMLGQIAEQDIRWHDAATHYTAAARLNPTFDALRKASDFAERAGNFVSALRLSSELLELARASGPPERLAIALNEHGLNLRAQGRHVEAESLYIQALEIDRKTIGEAHPDFAAGLNNLAIVLEDEGRHPEAEVLYNQALEIGRNTIGDSHPNFAIALNNLATVVYVQGRYPEAEALFKQALEIYRTADMETHPDFATLLSNLARVLYKQNRLTESEPLYTQAVSIRRQTLGDTHPDTQLTIKNYIHLLEAHRPEAPEIITLRALVLP